MVVEVVVAGEKGQQDWAALAGLPTLWQCWNLDPGTGLCTLPVLPVLRVPRRLDVQQAAQVVPSPVPATIYWTLTVSVPAHLSAQSASLCEQEGKFAYLE